MLNPNFSNSCKNLFGFIKDGAMTHEFTMFRDGRYYCPPNFDNCELNVEILNHKKLRNKIVIFGEKIAHYVGADAMIIDVFYHSDIEKIEMKVNELYYPGGPVWSNLNFLKNIIYEIYDKQLNIVGKKKTFQQRLNFTEKLDL